ncbi:hypothetical protein [Parasitella parasitica]|uniref:Uncharacterized protein n=1 Tax=Parasitella parasitica TaxID=35722 RepID=A0A0B7MZT2_9FUNG|nr:hypothetical protein [Parasitella parasitica]
MNFGSHRVSIYFYFLIISICLIFGFLNKDIGANTSIQLHENGRSHKDEVERFLRGVYQKGRKDQEDAESVRRELARIEQAALNSVGIQDRYKVPSGSSIADKPIRKATTEYYTPPNVPTIEELRQQSQATEKQPAQGREEWALNKEIAKVGEWETVVTQPAANPALDVDDGNSSERKNNAESTAAHDQGAEFQDDDDDQEDLHHFKLKEKEYPADLDIAPETDQDSQEPLTFKKRKQSDSSSFKARKKKSLRKKD